MFLIAQKFKLKGHRSNSQLRAVPLHFRGILRSYPPPEEHLQMNILLNLVIMRKFDPRRQGIC